MQLSALAISRAVLVLPTPRTPVIRKACASRSPSAVKRVEEESGTKRGGLGAFFGAHVAIAAAHGEAVRFAHGFDAVKHDIEVEIAHETADDGELLIVFFAEDGVVALHEIEELGDDGADAFEVTGAAGTAEELREAGLEECDAAIRGIKLLGLRGEDHVRAVVTAEAEVLDEGAGVFAEIFAGAELQWIDEDADGDIAVLAGDLARGADERGVTLVQSAHGGNQDAAGAFVDGAPGTKLADVVDDVHDF